jgi:hypothetical protein
MITYIYVSRKLIGQLPSNEPYNTPDNFRLDFDINSLVDKINMIVYINLPFSQKILIYGDSL